jgi:phage terminase small subunit
MDGKPAEVARKLTPCGRVPGAPLKNRKHERVAQNLACGQTQFEACKWRDDNGNWTGAVHPAGSSYYSNARRLCQRPEIRERVAEIAAMEAEMAGIYAGWVLADTKMFARASLGKFFKRKDNGELLLTEDGYPQIDFAHASDDDLRTLSEVSWTQYGPKIKIHDSPGALERLGRYLSLWRDRVELTGQDGGPIKSEGLTDLELARRIVYLLETAPVPPAAGASGGGKDS